MTEQQQQMQAPLKVYGQRDPESPLKERQHWRGLKYCLWSQASLRL